MCTIAQSPQLVLGECIDLNSFSFPNIVLRWWLVKRLFWPKDTIWASGDSLWYPVLDEVGHDDEVDGPVARVEQEEHEGEDVGGGAIEAQLEPSQLCLKIHRIQSKTIFGDQVILKHIWFISVFQLKVDVRVCPLSNRVIMAKETFAKLWGSVL